jgi:hypothetical protein
MQQRALLLTAISSRPPLTPAVRRLKRKSRAPQAQIKEIAKSSAPLLGIVARSNAFAYSMLAQTREKE